MTKIAKNFIFITVSVLFLFHLFTTSALAECGSYTHNGAQWQCSGLTNPNSFVRCPANSPNDCCNSTAACAPPPVDPFGGVTDETLDSVNPLRMFSSPHADQFSTPGGIVSRALDFAFPIAGLILFVMLVWGGFEILAGAAGKKSLDAGKQRATAAVIGFLLLFSSYWIAQIVEYVFGVAIL